MSAVTGNSQASPAPVRVPAPVGSVFELGWLMAQLFDDRRRKSFDVRQPTFNQPVQLPLVADLDDAELLKFLVTDLHDLVAVFPDVSVARALIVWVPFVAVVVSQVTENGELVTGVPSGAPSSSSCTLAIATLSAAFAVTGTDPLTVWPSVGVMTSRVGGCVSGGAPPAGMTSTAARFHASPVGDESRRTTF